VVELRLFIVAQLLVKLELVPRPQLKLEPIVQQSIQTSLLSTRQLHQLEQFRRFQAQQLVILLRP